MGSHIFYSPMILITWPIDTGASTEEKKAPNLLCAASLKLHSDVKLTEVSVWFHGASYLT